MRNIKLIALDLDGTLLDSGKRLSGENAAALEKAVQAGIEIVPATGRFYRGMPELIRSLPYVHYVITVNGAQVWDVREQRTVCGSELRWQRAVEIMSYLDTLPVIYDCYQDGWGWMTKRHYEQAADYAANPHSLDMIRRLRTPVPELKAYLAEQKKGVQKLQFFFRDMALRKQVLETLPACFPDTVVTTSIVNNIEINSLGATKGNALTQLAETIGLDMDQTMAFGDDLNDIAMLRAAGIGVAMGNAAPDVRQAADYVTEDCDHSGVAKAIRTLLWEEEA